MYESELLEEANKTIRLLVWVAIGFYFGGMFMGYVACYRINEDAIVAAQPAEGE